jgi:hypothetical protein
MRKLFIITSFSLLSLVGNAQLSVMAVSNDATCFGACDGAASASATGGQQPYTYLWTPSNYTNSSPPNLCAGTHTCTVTDALGATATATVLITEPSALTLSATPGPTTICAGTNVAYNAVVSGGTPPYYYSWNFPGGSPTTSNIANPVVYYAGAGNFTTTCWIMDFDGCSMQSTFVITVTSGPALTISHVPSTCNQSNGTMAASNAMTYWWMPGNLTTASINGLASGTTYTVTGTDPSGCTSTATMMSEDSCDYVWPGDANDDAVADNIDILDIGIANGATGTTRANATLAWIGQPSTAWGTTLASGTDYKWVDCDGNGTINPVDTQAVVLNYGMTHTNRLIAPSTNAVAPTLSISFDQDSLNAGQTGTISLSIGDTVDGVTNGYGLAFRLNYDATQLSTPTFGMMGGATWFGTPGTDLMRVVLHPNAANGYVDVAITRLDQQNVNGYGMIGQIYFTTTTNLVGTGNTVNVAATITNVVLTDASGTTQTVNVANDNVVVADTGIILAVAPIGRAATAVYPNPANENLHVQIPAGALQVITIEDLSGRIVYSHTHVAGMNSISVADLPGGMYILRATDVNGNSSSQKITISH